jgi:hypothetical protein
MHAGVRIRRIPNKVRDHPSSRGTGGVRSTNPEQEHFRSFVDKEKAEIAKELKAE